MSQNYIIRIFYIRRWWYRFYRHKIYILYTKSIVKFCLKLRACLLNRDGRSSEIMKYLFVTICAIEHPWPLEFSRSATPNGKIDDIVIVLTKCPNQESFTVPLFARPLDLLGSEPDTQGELLSIPFYTFAV
jgi:hypothetical protein